MRITPVTLAAGLLLAVALAVIGVSSTGAGSSTPVSGDVDCSGQVNGQDALKILRYQAGLANQLPLGCPLIGGTTASPTPPASPTPTVSLTPAASPTKTPGVLGPPQHIGHVDANGKARVKIENDAPHPLTVEFDGPEHRTILMDACAACHDYSIVGPVFCPKLGPVETIDLIPGTYTVTVSSTDPNINAFRGSWALDADQSYFRCFVVVKPFHL